MRTQELLLEIERLLAAVGTSTAIASLVRPFAEAQHQVAAVTPRLHASPSTRTAQELTKVINEVKSSFKASRPREVFESLTRFANAVKHFEAALPNQRLTTLKRAFKEFEEHYSKYLYDPNDTNRFSVMAAGQQFQASLETTTQLLFVFRDSLSIKAPSEANQAQLSLSLDSDLTLAVFGKKLELLSALYNEVAVLLSVSAAEQPIKIVKIESGSLWAVVFGDSRVIAMVESVLVQGTKFLHRTFTKEGKIGQIPRQVDAVESLLGLRAQLEGAGVDTTEMTEHLSKSSIVISKNLTELLKAAPNVTVNDQHMSLDAEYEQLMLEEGKTLALPEAPTETIEGVDVEILKRGGKAAEQ